MLSLIRPSASPCLRQDASAPLALAPTSTTLAQIPSSSSSTSQHPSKRLASSNSPSPAAKQRQTFNANPNNHTTSSSSSALSYKELVAQFTANAPQPYGTIPPRRRKTGASTNRRVLMSPAGAGGDAGSVGTPSSAVTTPSATASPKTRRAAPQAPSPVTCLELQPTAMAATAAAACSAQITDEDNGEARSSLVHTKLIQPLVHSIQSLLPESASSSTRLGFWANLKAQCMASTATFPWSTSGSFSNTQNAVDAPTSPGEGLELFSPPIALLVSNVSPVATVDATPLPASPLSDALLALPNLAPTPVQSCDQSSSPSSPDSQRPVNYPAAFAAVGKFRPARSDTIPLITFTYHETPVVERTRPPPPPPRIFPVGVGRMSNRGTKKSCTTDTNNTTKESKSDASSSEKEKTAPALPRSATRETRSNTDYLRMMAAELRMIRSRKLISPLRPRGYLPRRKDPFRRAKSPLCSCIELPREEDDHPLNDLMVGSWSSVSSADSFMTSSSSGYYTPMLEDQ